MTLSVEEARPSGASRFGRRRRWTDEEKKRIVAESEAPGCSVSIVARRHDLNANMLFTWRRRFRQREAGSAVEQTAFIPAIIATEEVGGGQPAAPPREQRTGMEDGAARRQPGLMEIVLAGGSRVIVDREVSAAALARVIGILERRLVCRSPGEGR
jgi:transposase